MNKTRRVLVSALGCGAAAIPLAGLLAPAALQAADMPKLDPDDPTAKSLNYTHESPAAERRCAGCQFYTSSNADWGHCVIFPGKLVNAKGLCNSWYARA